jgi:hypothetical protein
MITNEPLSVSTDLIIRTNSASSQKMPTVLNFEVMSDKFNVDGICG